jgi:hypothetical protein
MVSAQEVIKRPDRRIIGMRIGLLRSAQWPPRCK